MKSFVVDARSRRGGIRRTEKPQLAGNPGRPDEAEARRVELEKAAGPAGAQRALGGVVADRGFSLLADADGEALRDRAVGREKGRGKERADVGLVPAAVHPVFLNLLFRVRRRPLGGTGVSHAVVCQSAAVVMSRSILIPRQGLVRQRATGRVQAGSRLQDEKSRDQHPVQWHRHASLCITNKSQTTADLATAPVLVATQKLSFCPAPLRSNIHA